MQGCVAIVILEVDGRRPLSQLLLDRDATVGIICGTRDMIIRNIMKPARILIMDDEETVRDFLAFAFKRLGCKVTAVKHGREAVAWYRHAMSRRSLDGSGDSGRSIEHPAENPTERYVDLIILDLIVRGGQGGVETLRQLRELDPDIRAVIMSGMSDDPVMVDPAAFGFWDVLEKPFSFNRLKELVNRIMEAS